MRQAKYIQIAESLQRRINNGDYAFSTLPGAQRLASEVGVSYLTARQAVQKLIHDGVLRRRSSGRLEVCSAVSDKKRNQNLNVALIVPGSFNNSWVNQIYKTSQSFKCSFRTITYGHDDDPVIFEALNGKFDIIIISFVRSDNLFISKLIQHKDKVVTLFHDFTEFGLRCLDGPSPKLIIKMMEYLKDLGHKEIDMLSAQPVSRTITERIHQWQNGRELLGIGGQLHHYPVQSFESAVKQSYSITHKLLDSGELNASALFCATVATASAVLRACFERGVKVGEDISVCSFGEPEMASMLIPSLTVVDTPGPTPEITAIFEQFLNISDSPGRLMFRAGSDNLLIGESTGAPKEII